MRWFITSFCTIFSASCSILGIQGVEEPSYQVIHESDNKEIRLYEPYIMATTLVEGSYRDAQSRGFRILASYIFGNNTAKEEISMTAPVKSEAQPEEISMTAPVIQTASQNKWQVSFVMPKKYTKIQEMPEPLDKRVAFTKVPQRYAAVLGFTWWTSAERNQGLANQLIAWLKSKEYKPVLPFKVAGYDPPWTIPFLRRNEIIIDLDKN